MLLKDIKSSYLKTPIKVLSRSSSIDKFGIENIQYVESPFIKGWPKNSSYKKMEFLTSQGINSMDSKELIIRFRNLKSDDVILINNVKYEILSIENIEEKNLFLSLTIGCVKNGSI